MEKLITCTSDCSIVGVVGMESNRVGIVVENSTILVDLYISKEAS